MTDFVAVQNICLICKCSVATYYANEELFKDYMPEHIQWHEDTK